MDATFATPFKISKTVRNFPVSGDETLREFGRNGRRVAVNIWQASGVRPRIATTGIRVGDGNGIGDGVVPRVGTIAGFFISNGREQRWEIGRVREIIPAPDARTLAS